VPPATATPTPVAGSQTVTFDDLQNPNRPFSGQYPSGVIDWGTNAWFLSGPFGAFRTQSVGFNGSGPTTAGFRILNGSRLVSLDAYNGGSGPSTLTVACAGQPTLTSSLGAGQTTTLRPSWTAACANVTIGSSNGWNTNFDSVVLGTTAAPTATPTPTSGSGSSVTVTFDDLTNPNRTFGGQYPSGVIDWGSNAWYLSGPFGAFQTQSVGFNGAGPTSATLRILNGQRLVSVDAYNGGTGPTTLTIVCAGQPTLTVSLGAGQSTTLRPAWTAACANVTIGSSNGWNTNFDTVSLQS
jgi:hypothetical protein